MNSLKDTFISNLGGDNIDYGKKKGVLLTYWFCEKGVSPEGIVGMLEETMWGLDFFAILWFDIFDAAWINSSTDDYLPEKYLS